MTHCVPIDAICFDLAKATDFYLTHLAEPGADLAGLLLPSGEWLALAPEAGELRDGAVGGAQ